MCRAPERLITIRWPMIRLKNLMLLPLKIGDVPLNGAKPNSHSLVALSRLYRANTILLWDRNEPRSLCCFCAILFWGQWHQPTRSACTAKNKSHHFLPGVAEVPSYLTTMALGSAVTGGKDLALAFH